MICCCEERKESVSLLVLYPKMIMMSHYRLVTWESCEAAEHVALFFKNKYMYTISQTCIIKVALY